MGKTKGPQKTARDELVQASWSGQQLGSGSCWVVLLVKWLCWIWLSPSFPNNLRHRTVWMQSGYEVNHTPLEKDKSVIYPSGMEKWLQVIPSLTHYSDIETGISARIVSFCVEILCCDILSDSLFGKNMQKYSDDWFFTRKLSSILSGRLLWHYYYLAVSSLSFSHFIGILCGACLTFYLAIFPVPTLTFLLPVYPTSILKLLTFFRSSGWLTHLRTFYLAVFLASILRFYVRAQARPTASRARDMTMFGYRRGPLHPELAI